MHPEPMNRKLFLKLTLTGVATSVVGACSGEEAGTTDMGATSGTMGTGTGTMTSTTSSTGTSSMTNTATATTTATSSSATVTSTTGTTGTATGTTGTGTTGTTGTGTTGTGTTGTGTMGGAGGSTGTTTQGTMTGTTGMGGAGGMGGGTSGGSCTAEMLELVHEETQFHTHLPLMAGEQTALVMIINGGAGGMLTFAGPDDHSHTLTFSAEEVMTLATGGMLTGKVSSTDDNHSHTFDIISCA